MKQKLGFIGVGIMGGGMCRRILEVGQYDLTVFDVDQSRVDELVALGAKAATSLEQLVANSDIIACSLPNPAIVKGALLKESVMQSMQQGQIIIDLSTLDSGTSKDISALLEPRGVLYVDTPVSGGKADTVKGTLTLIIGGREDELTACIPLFNTLGTSVHFAGARGAGSTIKLVNNVMSLGNLLVASEAFVLGAKAGVDGGTLFRILQHCGGRSLRMLKQFPNALKGNFEPGFVVDLAEKDLTLALDMAHRLKVPMMMASLSHDTYLTCSKTGRGALDTSAVLQYLAELNGVEVRGDTEVVVKDI